MALTACVTPAPAPTIPVPENLRAHIADTAKPDLPPPSGIPFASRSEEERPQIWNAYVRPLMRFSIDQEAVKEAERARADGLLALIDKANRAQKPKSWLDRLRGPR